MGWRSWFLAGAIVAFGPSGCGSSSCSGDYNCPAGGGEVLVPDNLPAAISSLTADAPCFIALVGLYTEGPVPVNVTGSISAGTTVTCRVHAELSNGAEMVASLSFQTIPCCGIAGMAGAAPTFGYVDGGVASNGARRRLRPPTDSGNRCAT